MNSEDQGPETCLNQPAPGKDRTNWIIFGVVCAAILAALVFSSYLGCLPTMSALSVNDLPQAGN